jgi:hypothetical protein
MLKSIICTYVKIYAQPIADTDLQSCQRQSILQVEVICHRQPFFFSHVWLQSLVLSR